MKKLIRYFRSLLPDSSSFETWEKAQFGELEWWKDVADRGYKDRTRDEFINIGQRGWMLSQLKFLEKSGYSWKNGVVVEFGSGPSGLVEYIDAKRKIAIEPLIEHYRKIYPHLAKSDVEYWNCQAEEIGHNLDNLADFVICFNVLDHTQDPELVMRNFGRVAKSGADMLFQVNVYKSNEQIMNKTKSHANLHPHSFFPEKIIDLLQKNRFEIRNQWLSDEMDENGEYFFICAGYKK